MIRVDEPSAGVVLVTIDRAHARNAMTFAMWESLRETATVLDGRDDVRAVVITGAGDRAFVAGTDIAEFAAFTTPDDGIAYEARVDRVIAALEAIRVPTIAAIVGACTGGGVSIAAACDLRIGAAGARVGVPIARTLGNCISLHNLARVAELIGLDATKALLLTGELVDADTALRLGFFSEIAANDADVLDRALALAERMTALAPLTLRASKEMVRRIRLARPLPADEDLIRGCYGSDDFHAGVRAFLAKRSVSWSGR